MPMRRGREHLLGSGALVVFLIAVAGCGPREERVAAASGWSDAAAGTHTEQAAENEGWSDVADCEKEATPPAANSGWALEKCEIADWGYSGYLILEGCICHWRQSGPDGLLLVRELFMPLTPNAFAGSSARRYIENEELRGEAGE